MRACIYLGVVLATGVLLSGCEGNSPGAPSASAGAKKPVEKPAAAAAAAAAAPAYVYVYNPVGKRDPFRSPVEEFRTTAGTGASLCTEPLCQWDLDQLTLVAVVTGDASPVAMVEDPQGRGFVVRRSTRMGKQGGKVTNILRDSVTVTEYYATPDGKVTANPVSLKLKAENNKPPNLDLATGRLVQ